MLEKYDTEKDGKLNPEEEAAWKEDIAVMAAKEANLGKYDKGGEGNLSSKKDG